MTTDEEIRQKAKKKAEDIIGFYTHLTVYVVVNIMLFAIWWFTGVFSTFPWFVFPLFGWGIGLAVHGIRTYGDTYGSTNLAHKIEEREYQKMKSRER